MIPAGMLGICSTIITRPSWESTFKYVLMGVICCGFLAATCLAYFDSNSIVSRAILATVRVLPGQSKGNSRLTITIYGSTRIFSNFNRLRFSEWRKRRSES